MPLQDPFEILLRTWARLGHSEFAIRTVRNYCLTRLKTQLDAVELHRNYVRLERHESGNASDFGISLTIRPCRKTCVAGVVITAQAFVRTEGLMFYESQRGLIDVGAQNVPSRRKAGLVEDERPLSIGDNAVLMANHEVARRLANVDAVVTVCSMPEDPFVFFVEGVHGPPGKRNSPSQLACIGG